MAQTLVQRGLTTQSYGTQTLASPGDLTAVVGTFTRRPYGPYLSGNIGWSAHNSRVASVYHTWAIGASDACATKGTFGAWFFITHGDDDDGSNGLIFLIDLTSVGGGESVLVQLNATTNVLKLWSTNSRFVAQDNLKTLPNNKWFWLQLAWQTVGAGTTVDLKLLYREAGGSTTTLATVSGYEQFGQKYDGILGGAISNNGARVAMRYGLPSLYSITTLSEAIYPTEIFEPPTVPNTWYVSSAATGGGLGYSLAEAWTGTELANETGSAFTVMSGNIVNPITGDIIDPTVLDTDVLVARYKAGTAIPYGDVVYFDDTSGPVRFTKQFNPSLCDGVRLLPITGLGHKVDVRATTRIAPSDWSVISGNNYKASIACAFPVVFEFDSVADANGRETGVNRWLAHPSGITTSVGFAAASTDGSFGTNAGGGLGTEVYLRCTGSGDPRSSGKIYEVSTTITQEVGGGNGDIILVSCNGLLAKDILWHYCDTVDTNNSAGPSGRMHVQGTGLIIFEGCDAYAWGRHSYTISEAGDSVHQRVVFLNNTVGGGRPAVYGGGSGAQTVTVQDGTTNGADNQWYYEGNVCTTTAGTVGSKIPTIDISNATMLEHTSGGAHPYSKGWLINNVMPGTNTVGVTTSTVVAYGNNFGSAGGANVFGGTSLTMYRNKIIDLALPTFGELSGTSTIYSNVFVLSGAIVTPLWYGTISFKGNTVDATVSTGNTATSLASRGGVVLINFSGNVLLLNNSATYRLFGTITPASGDSLTMAYNQIQGSDSTRILVTAYAGANTKTLAQLVSGGQDTASAFAADLKYDSGTFRLGNDSAGHEFVPLASVTGLASTVDYYGNLRPPSGSVDTGATQASRGRVKKFNIYRPFNNTNFS